MEWTDGGNVKGDGFTVRSGFNFSVYREEHLVVTLDVKRGFRGHQHLVVIPKDAFRRCDNDATDNSPAEQVRMRSNFVAVMEFCGHVVE
jgi:hypothetical protein